MNLWKPYCLIALLALTACQSHIETDFTAQQIESLIEQGNALMTQNPAKAIETFEHAKNLSLTTEEKAELANIHQKLGYLYLIEGEFSQSNHNLRLALHFGLYDSDKNASAFYHLGRVNQKLKNYSNAVTYYKKALEHYVAKDLTDDVGLLSLYLGQSSAELKAFEEALEFYSAAADIATATNNSFLLGTSMNSKGNSLLEIEQYDEAISLFKSTLLKTSTKTQKAITTHNLARAYYLNQELEKAAALFEQALTLKQQVGNVPSQINSHYNYHEVLAAQGKAAAAQAQLEQAVALARNGVPLTEAVALSHEALQALYQAQGNYAGQVAVLQQVSRLQDEALEVVKDNLSQYDHLKVQYTDQSIAHHKAMQLQKANARKNLLYLGAAIAVLVALIAYLAYKRYRQKHMIS